MYFVKRDGRYIDASGQSFRDFMAGELPALPGERPTIKDWDDHLTTLFPEVRLKPIWRCAAPTPGRRTRLCALPRCGSACCTTRRRRPRPGTCARHWTIEEREALRGDAARLGLKATDRRPHACATWPATSWPSPARA